MSTAPVRRRRRPRAKTIPSDASPSGPPLAHPPPRRKRAPVPAERRCNELDGKRWLQYSLSVWSDIRRSAEEQRLRHPAMFPVALVERLMQSYLRADGRVVLDPFMGSGSTLVAAHEAGRDGIGFELSDEYIELTRRRLESRNGVERNCSVDIRRGDSRKLVADLAPDSIDLCVTSPPYWNILNQQRTADAKAKRHYGNLTGDLGTVASYPEFVRELGSIFAGVLTALRSGCYCCINVMDLRKKDCFYPLHADLARELVDRGFIFDDLVIWNRGAEYNNLRPLGYPYTFRINKVHEYVVILRKPPAKNGAPKSRGVPPRSA